MSLKRLVLSKTDRKPVLAVRPGGAASKHKATNSTKLIVRLTRPKPSELYAAYWRFAKLRQDAYFARLSQGSILSEDPVVQRYRFTNVYRAADRVSQYLIRHVLYDRRWSSNDFVFRTLIFKFFNKIETWEALEAEAGPITWANYRYDSYGRIFDRLLAAGRTIYSAAYIMPSGKSEFGYQRKHRNHLKVIELMMRKEMPERIASARSLEDVFRTLCSFPTVGPFIGYQLAVDLNYGPLINFSENDFVQAGPGAIDGISKCFSDLGDFTPSDVIRYMADQQDEAFETHGAGFKNLWGRRLHLIDCQNLFCEVSKYSRVTHPSVKGSSGRTRIKQLYRPSVRAADRPWFPPKWGVNDRIAHSHRD